VGRRGQLNSWGCQKRTSGRQKKNPFNMNSPKEIRTRLNWRVMDRHSSNLSKIDESWTLVLIKLTKPSVLKVQYLEVPLESIRERSSPKGKNGRPSTWGCGRRAACNVCLCIRILHRSRNRSSSAVLSILLCFFRHAIHACSVHSHKVHACRGEANTCVHCDNVEMRTLWQCGQVSSIMSMCT